MGLIWPYAEPDNFGISGRTMNVLKLYAVGGAAKTAPRTDADAAHDRGANDDRGANPGLDLVRVLAALGVVLLHAGVPYLRHPMPGLTWSVTDSASELVDVMFWSIEIFIMPVFLVIAGFLLTPTLVRRGPSGMLAARWKRLARPLLFGVLVILPIDFYLWLGGWVSEGIIPVRKMQSLKFDGGVDRDLWGLSHLWFLLYMLTYIVLVAAVATIAQRSSRLSRLLKNIQRPTVLLPIAAIVAVMTVGIRPEVVWGFQHRFEPVPSKWLYSLMFFLAGMVWATHDPKLLSLSRLAQWRYVGLASVCGVAALMMGRWHLAMDAGQHESLATKALLATLTVTAATSLATVGIAVAVANTRRTGRVMAYLAAASFWLYLVHHPLLVLVHIDLKWLLPSAPGAIKMVISFAISVAVSLAMYEVLVRRTRFGRWTGLGPASMTSGGDSGHPTWIRMPVESMTGVPTRRAA